MASSPVSDAMRVACRLQGSNSLMRVIGWSAMRVSTSRRNASGLWPLSFALPSKLYIAAARSPPTSLPANN